MCDIEMEPLLMDRIRIYVNYKVVAYEALLDGDFKSLEINLEKGLIELILKR
jgi:hypothetical protein